MAINQEGFLLQDVSSNLNGNSVKSMVCSKRVMSLSVIIGTYVPLIGKARALGIEASLEAFAVGVLLGFRAAWWQGPQV
jgi:hypothetical protein